MKTTVLPLILLLAGLSGCAQVTGGDNEPQVVDAQTVHRLHQRDWDLKGLTVDGRQVVIDADTRITIRFARDGQVGGIAAVNRFGGTYNLSTEGKLNWGKAGFTTTRMMGPPELMEKEQVYLLGLAKVNVAILARHILVLQSDDASTVLRFNEAGF
jgi:heat shock protein HslJ